ncbi:hypothetical protein HK103_002565 [Boothiomyces macroporosus]|uniref:Uncharacterized protein n=1 Tax=Boothiomyces macroporosus TaxID=261099 RepID=A0AAD5UCZ8_9FUNG|nr:hypothetical protein HK103_002565 [Boothiomyces macroporosus]
MTNPDIPPSRKAIPNWKYDPTEIPKDQLRAFYNIHYEIFVVRNNYFTVEDPENPTYEELCDVSKMLPENAQLVSVNMDRGLYRILAEKGNHHTFSLEKVKAKLEEAPQDIPHIVDFDDRFHDIYHIKAPRCRFIPALLVVENGKVSYMGQVEYWKDLAKN